MRWIDVSMPLEPGMPAFPGDPPFRLRSVRALGAGGAFNLSAIDLGSHTGTHVDPPAHFLANGAGIDAVDLELLNGPAFLLEIPPSRRSIGPAELTGIPAGTRRLLLKTANSSRWAENRSFFPDYVALTQDGAEHLMRGGVDLVGIDSLSIEKDLSGTFPVHTALLRQGRLILEGLLLAGAPSGPVELACLPLLIRDGDGGPARAALRLP